MLGTGVQRGGRLIHDEDGGVAVEGASNRGALPLTAREVVSAPGLLQSLTVLDRRWSGQAEEVQRAVEGLVGHLAEPGGDIRVACPS